MIKNKLVMATAVLLSLLIAAPLFLTVPSTAQIPTQSRIVGVESYSSRGWLKRKMGSYSVTKYVENYTRIETWTNGTKGYFSVHIFDDNSQYSDMWVNCTAWLPEKLTAPQTSGFSTLSLQPLSEGSLPKEWIDNVKFIYGSNSTCHTTYKHDDNYETYYPLQWNAPYTLEGQTKTHIHLTQELLDQWKNGNLTTSCVMALIVAGYDCLLEYITMGIDPFNLPKSILETLLVAAVQGVLGLTPATAVAIILVLADIFMAIIEYVGKMYWIENTVREQYLPARDGWAWRGSLNTFLACRPIDPYFWQPMTVYNWHRICSFTQTWGKDGVFGIPQSYMVDLGFHRQTTSRCAHQVLRWV